MLRHLLAVALAAPPLALLAACSRAPAPADPDFATRWKAWHERRLERLRAPDGWLALSGLHWLAQGENRIAGLPGVFLLEGDRVTLVASPADGYTLDGAPVARRALESDAGGKPERLKLAPGRTLAIIDRGAEQRQLPPRQSPERALTVPDIVFPHLSEQPAQR